MNERCQHCHDSGEVYKATHGRCCYCGQCGKLHDECRCSLDETCEENERLERDLLAVTAERDRLREALSEAASAMAAPLEEVRRLRADTRSAVEVHRLLNLIVPMSRAIAKADAALALLPPADPAKGKPWGTSGYVRILPADPGPEAKETNVRLPYPDPGERTAESGRVAAEKEWRSRMAFEEGIPAVAPSK